MSVTAVIPVREGSRRLKNKNIAPFTGPICSSGCAA